MSGSSTTFEPVVSTESGEGRGGSGSGIRCPLCGWKPQAHDCWSCKCGHVWNVFDTGGVCPACLHQATNMQCGGCGRYSLHSDWYEYKG